MNPNIVFVIADAREVKPHFWFTGRRWPSARAGVVLENPVHRR